MKLRTVKEFQTCLLGTRLLAGEPRAFWPFRLVATAAEDRLSKRVRRIGVPLPARRGESGLAPPQRLQMRLMLRPRHDGPCGSAANRG
jgi:hypothetical protein